MTEHTATAGSHHANCWCCQFSENIRRATMEFEDTVRNMGPSEEVKSHFRNARVEFLKGIRRIIDERIERVQRGRSGGSAGFKVPVD